MANKKEYLFINILTPKEGKMQEFVRVQTGDFAKYRSELDGSISNRFYLSVNEEGEGHCVNVARFESIDAYYEGTNTPVFHDHIERIKPLIERTQPMLLEKVWDSEASMETEKIMVGELLASRKLAMARERVRDLEQR